MFLQFSVMNMKRSQDITSLFHRHAARKAVDASNTSPGETLTEEHTQEQEKMEHTQ
jgi:hypothetical protein